MANIWHDIHPSRISHAEFIAVIEISKGGKNKYELDKETGMLMLDLGADFLERRNQLIEAVSLADVQAAAARLFHPEAMRVVAVGKPEGLTPSA